MSDATVNVTRKEYLRRLLCPFWLRPESALWYAHEACLARQYLGMPMQQPSLEFGCIDGTATFIMLGGEFGLGFDVYSEVAWRRDSIVWQSLNDDYYNTSHPDRSGELDIQVFPNEQFDYGLSWKKAHLDKAARLAIHKRLIEHDPDKPLVMFADQSLATVWAPNLYWVSNLDGVVGELHRVLYKGGRLITVLPDVSALDHMLYRFVDQLDSDWIKDLDRGRHSNIARHARSFAEWARFFTARGFRLTRYEQFISQLVFQVNDIGFRPMFPVLMHIYETLQQHCPTEWLSIKEQWMHTAFHFLAPLCETEWMDKLNMDKVWHIFELVPTHV